MVQKASVSVTPIIPVFIAKSLLVNSATPWISVLNAVMTMVSVRMGCAFAMQVLEVKIVG